MTLPGSGTHRLWVVPGVSPSFTAYHFNLPQQLQQAFYKPTGARRDSLLVRRRRQVPFNRPDPRPVPAAEALLQICAVTGSRIGNPARPAIPVAARARHKPLSAAASHRGVPWPRAAVRAARGRDPRTGPQTPDRALPPIGGLAGQPPSRRSGGRWPSAARRAKFPYERVLPMPALIVLVRPGPRPGRDWGPCREGHASRQSRSPRPPCAAEPVLSTTGRRPVVSGPPGFSVNRRLRPRLALRPATRW